MLSEAEVQRTFKKLLTGEVTPERLARAEALLDKLRPESPLRHRLADELEEIRTRHLPNDTTAA